MAISWVAVNNRRIMPRHSRTALPPTCTRLIAAPLAAIAVAVAVALTFSPPAIAAESQAAMPASALLRTAIVTTDLAASKRFYVDGLGFAIRFDGDITRPAVAQQLGLLPGQTAWFVVLKGAESLHGRPVVGAMVGLLRVDRPAPPAMRRPDGAALAAGEAMLAIETDRFDEIEQRLRAMNATFVVAPTPSPDGRETEMVVRDPSGVRVHIVERRPATTSQTLSRSPIRSGSR